MNDQPAIKINPSGLAHRSFRLIIDQQSLLPQVAQLVLDQNMFLVGRVTQRIVGRWNELILDHWQPEAVIPDGQTLPPMSDWAVAGCLSADNAEPDRARQLLQMVRPRQSQMVVAIALNPADQGRFPVVIFDQGQIVRPLEIRFIGPEMIQLPEVQIPATPTIRQSRTVGALGDAYYRLGQMSIAIVGTGRGGSELATQLVAAGVRRLTVIDGDQLREENLDAMPTASSEWLGLPKAVTLGKALQRNQPDLLCRCVPVPVHSEQGMQALQQSRYDLIASFVDSDVARLAVTLACQQTSTIHLDIGCLIENVNGRSRMMTADIRLFHPRSGCATCVPPISNLEDLLYELSRPAGCLLRVSRKKPEEILPIR